jgi:hypothetical protein
VKIKEVLALGAGPSLRMLRVSASLTLLGSSPASPYSGPGSDLRPQWGYNNLQRCSKGV